MRQRYAYILVIAALAVMALLAALPAAAESDQGTVPAATATYQTNNDSTSVSGTASDQAAPAGKSEKDVNGASDKKSRDKTAAAEEPAPVTDKIGPNLTCDPGGDCAKPACSDGLDNDADTRVDMDDPGCASTVDPDETDPAPPPPPPPGGGGSGGGGTTSSCSGIVVIYENTGFGGRCKAFSSSQTFVGSDFNDLTSSIKVAAGYGVTLFQNSDYGGAYANSITASDPWGWSGVGDNAVSSFIVQALPDTNNSFTGTVADTDIWNSFSMAGCSGVYNQVYADDRYGRRTLDWRLSLRFCWNGTRITSVYEQIRSVKLRQPPWPLSYITGWEWSDQSWIPATAGYSTAAAKHDISVKFCAFQKGCAPTQYHWMQISLSRFGGASCTSDWYPTPRPCKRF